MNNSSASAGYSFNLSGFSSLGTTVSRYQTSSSYSCQALSNLSVANKTFSDTVPAQSVTTYVLSSAVYQTPAVSFDANATYLISNRYSSKSWNIKDWSTADGAYVIQWTDGNNANCSWRVIDGGGGVYQLKNVNSGKAASVEGWSTQDGALVNQWTWGGSANDTWLIKPTGDGYYYITNRNSGKAVHVADWSTADGASLVQWAYNGSPNGEWVIQKR